MSFVIESRPLADLAVVVPEAYRDDRGFFAEVYREDQFAALGLTVKFVQDNHSYSRKGVVRGLHFQWTPPMGKLMRVTRGSAFLVAVDIRKGSPTLGKWFGVEASADNMKQVWGPAGFARGFCAMTDDVEVQYKCTGIYNGAAEAAIRWDDPDIGITWPVKDARLSDKDRNAQTLKNWLASADSEKFSYEPQVVLSR